LQGPGANRASFFEETPGVFEMEKRKFGNKLKLPSVAQIKHQILLRWLADQTAIEANETAAKHG
jgi:hypothetical protein